MSSYKYSTVFKIVQIKQKKKQDHRCDMRQFLQARGPLGKFFRKITKKRQVLNMVFESVCTNFQVCIVFRLVMGRNTDTYTNKQIHEQI